MKNNFNHKIAVNKTYNLFTEILGIPISEKDKKTVKRKDVDLFFVFGLPIYAEVKSNQNEENFRGGPIGENNIILVRRCLKRSIQKFLDNNCNILVINDSNILRLPIFESLKLLPNLQEEIRAELDKYKKISAVMILSPNYEEVKLKYWLFSCNKCLKPLPRRLQNVLDMHKSNKEI